MSAAKPTSDPYRVLGLVRAADADQIKAAHRRLAKRYHPDGSTGDEKRFLAVQEAYQLLSDPGRRGDWDRAHAPGPVRADGARARRTAAAPGPGSTGRTNGGPPSAATPRRPARDGRSRSRTWSAKAVPWWEDFRPGKRDGDVDPAAADGTTDHASPFADEPAEGGTAPTVDFDVFSRSSGAAWSMAARRHFRRGDEDLPSRGAWRYRGTQVVTGAEARKVAAEEAAAEATNRQRSRRRADRSEGSGREPGERE